jgi:hypothetical protein
MEISGRIGQEIGSQECVWIDERSAPAFDREASTAPDLEKNA